MPPSLPRDPLQDAASSTPHRPGGAVIEQSRPSTSFIGRDDLLAEIHGALARDDVRLLTLTGPGGVGKTRIAHELAGSASGFVDGVRFVSLAAVRDAALVGDTIARALDIATPAGIPVEDALVTELAGWQGMLVLDNFEQVADAAALVGELMARSRRLKVLVTSRTTLRLSGEYIVAVPPLSLPDDAATSGQDASDSEAVRLFVERAREVRADFAPDRDDMRVISAICDRLSGLPLAIELAAARVSVLSLPNLLTRLDQRMAVLIGGPADAPARHRTMRKAIAWSYSLLPPGEQRLLRRMAVFDGGVTLDAVEAIAAWPLHDATAGSEADLAVDMLSALVDHNLVNRLEAAPDSAEPRFDMLGVVREFALELLVANGESAVVRDAHAAFFLALATEGETHLVREVDPVWLDRLEAEHPNLRGALAWALREGAAPDTRATGVQLAGTLWLFWYYHSHLLEGRAWLERALQTPDGVPAPARARAMVGFGTLLHFLGEGERARAVLLQGLDALREIGDTTGMAYALTGLGNIAEDLGRYDDAAQAFTAANALFADLDDQVNVAVTLYHLGVVAVGFEDLPLATERLEHALALSRRAADPWSAAASLSYLGLVRGALGDIAGAADALDEALALYRQLGTIERIVEVLRRVAVLAVARRDPARALRLFAAAGAIGARIGMAEALPERDMYQRAVAAADLLLSQTRRAAARDRGATLTLEEAIAEARQQLDACRDPYAAFSMPPGAAELSRREMDVLLLMVEGKGDAEIAELLSISRRTVTTHAGHIYTKLNVTSRAAAVAFAVRHGLA